MLSDRNLPGRCRKLSLPPARPLGPALLPLLAALSCAAQALPARAAPPVAIIIEYRDKPPYSYTARGRPAGLLIDKTAAILRRAGLSYQFSEVPVKRIVQDLQTSPRPTCTPGWYKLPEREAYAQFTLTMHQDRPQVVLAAAGSAAAVGAHHDLKSLLRDPKLQLAVVDGVSYGPELDRQIAERPRAPLRATVTVMRMSKMLDAGRADFMFIDEEDLRWLDRNQALSRQGVKRVSFADAPAGLPRHLMCSKNMPAEILTRINTAIRQLGLDGPAATSARASTGGPPGPDG
jgi:uncharacterized protein (TIGR02285 family)